MPLFGKIVVIKRNGTDGIHFPLTASSCLFGRKTECDIRIQLPQVSKEHCKIEVNENKEAILINLSTVNPTQLNGNSFQQPAHLKHGDVFTIVDRSFRFEYLPQSTPRKRLSRTPKNETLQVLHVQQVAEVDLQSPRSKSPQTSDKIIECEGQNFGEKDKKSTEEDISRVVPAKQHATPKTTYRTAKSNRRENEMSPFSKLYELLKNEIDVKTRKDGNEEIPMPRQAETNAQQISLLIFPSGQETQTKEKEAIVGEDIEQSEVKEQEIHSVELKQISTEGNSSKKTNEISSANSGEPRTGQDPSLGVKATEISNEIQKKDVVCSRVDGNESCILGKSNKYSKQKRNSKQLTPRKSLNAEEVLKEIHDETYSVSITKERDSETVEFSPGYSNSKSPKGSVRQGKKISNKSPSSELLTPERLTSKDASSASGKYHSGAQRGRRMSSGKMAEETLEGDSSQEPDKNVDIKGSDVKETLTTENYQQKLEVEDANIVLGPHRLSSKRRCSESVALLRDDEVASKINISSLPTEDKKSGETKRLPQKRKSGELELLHQPFGKRKRVSFGGHLSPELFDKSLPPNSPLRRGAIPARLSLPFGNSPRAVLKKGQGFKRLVIKDLSEHLQRQKSSQRNLPARRSPAPSPPAKRSPAASPPALKKASPKLTANSPSNTPYTKGRFSVSHISTPSPTSKEQGTAATEVKESERDFTGVETPESFHINQEHQMSVPTTPKQLIRRSIRFSAKRTPMKRRSDAVETIHSKRRSGASKANLLVAKSWAEVVKLGVARPQVKAVKKCVLKGKSAKKLTKSPKTPARKVKGHFSTGHADSPATIVIGKAHTTTVKLVGQAPRVVKNCALKQNMDINESFTGMTEMFRTPVNENQKSPSLSAAHKTDLTPSCAKAEGSEVHTPEESGEMVISPLSTSGMSQQRKDSQDVVSRFLRLEKSPNSAFVAAKLKQTPKKERTVLEEKVEMSNPLVMPEKHITEVTVRAKRLVKTPKQKIKPVEALSGVKRLLRTPKQKTEPVEALSGVKRLLRTPKQKTEPVEALSGVKRLLRTPKQKTEPVEALSGVRRLLRTPKQKTELVEALSGIKRLLRTPKQKTEPVEALSGVKRLLRTPKQKMEPLTDEIALKRLLKTPAQKKQVVNDLVGVCFMKTTQKQKCQPVEDKIGISHIMKTSNQRIQSEDMVGIKRLLKTKERVEPVEDMFGISRLLRTPREKYLPVDDYVGLQKLMAEPKQKYSNSELDYVGVKEIFDTPKEIKVKVTDLMQENNSPHIDPKHERESRGNYEREELKQEKRMEDSLEKTSLPFVRSRNRNIKNEQELQENFEHACISPKESEIVKNIENIEKEKISDGSPTESHNLSNSVISLLLTKMDPVQEPAMQWQRESSSSKNVRGHPLQTGLIAPEDKSDQGSVENNEKVALSVRKRSRREKKLEMLESLVPAKRTRRGKTEDNKQEFTEEHDAKEKSQRQTTRNPCRAETVKCVQTDEQDFANSTIEAAAVEESEIDKPTLEIMVTEMKGRKSLRVKSRKQLEETKKVSTEMVPENITSVQEAKRTSKETVVKTHKSIKNETKAAQGNKEAKTGQSLKLKESHFENTNDAPLDVYSSQANRNSIKKTNQTHGNNTGQKGILDIKEGEFAKNEKMIPQNISETEPETISTKDSLGSLQTVQSSKTKKAQNNPTAAMVYDERTVLRHGKRIRKGDGKQEASETKQIEILENNPTEANENTPRRDRGKKVHFELEEASSASLRGKHVLSEGNDKDQNETSENFPSQANENLSRRGRRKEVDLTPDKVSSTSLRKKDSLPESDAKKDQDAALESTASPTKENTSRRGRRKQVDHKVLAANSTSFGGKCTLPGDSSKEEMSESQNVPFEAIVLPTKEKLSRRGRRNQVSLTSQAANCTSLRGKRNWTENDDKDAIPKDQNVPLGSTTSQAKVNPSRKGRRQQVELTTQAASSTSLQGKSSLPENDDKEKVPKEDQNVPLENTTEAKANPPRKGRWKQVDLTRQAASSTSLRGKSSLPENDDKEKVPKEDQNVPLGNTTEAKANPPRKGRRKQIDLTTQAASSTSLRGKSSLPENDGKEKVPKEDQNVPLGNTTEPKANPPRKGRRKQVDLTTQAASSTSLRGKTSLPENDNKEKVSKEDQNVPLENITSQASKKGRRKQADLTTQAASSTSLRGKSSLPENDGKEKVPKEDQNVPLVNTTEAKANPPRKGRRKQVDLTTQAASSTSLRGKTSLPENDDKEKVPKEDQNVPLENITSQASKKGRRKQVDLTTQAASSTSLQGKSSLPENGGKEKVPKENQNVPLGNTTEAKANPPRMGRRKQVDLTTQAASSTSLRGKTSLPENDDKEKVPKEDQNVPLENITSQASKKGRRKQVDLTTQAASSTSLRGKSSLPENDGEEKVPKEHQNVPLGNTAEVKANPPRRGRRKQVDLTTQAASSTSLRGKGSLPENDGEEKVPKEHQNVPLGNTTEVKANPPRRGRRKQVDLTTQAASSTSLRGKGSLPENDKEKVPKEDQNVPLGNITSQASKKGRRKQVDLTSQVASSTSLREKRHLPEDEKAAKKLKSEYGQSITLQKETRNKTKGELGKGDISMIQSAGGTERKTRASARTRK
ncbi:proliferation marker protein Ki-67 [Chelonia mydas]|uniref:proliferation marker protein Ki-67 n=1 Tax=Chelonia mydas TaxID=8469 RepID=UPI0018A1C25D|nr:proliferation marker protein Ki-67 [Chelonia mydas]